MVWYSTLPCVHLKDGKIYKLISRKCISETITKENQVHNASDEIVGIKKAKIQKGFNIK